MPYVTANDEIFIGNEDFRNEQKAQHAVALLDICMTSANVLVALCKVNVKKVGSFTNKLFKMSDGYLQDYPGGPESADGKLARLYINRTFDSFKRKKDAGASEESMRASLASTTSTEV